MPAWGRGDAAALLALTLASLATALLVRPVVDAPLIDDWTYAWSVKHWLLTGELRVLDWSAHYPLAQTIWAGVFSQLFGFSHATLRLSTLVLGWIGLVAFFLTLRVVGVGTRLSALGALALLCNPVLFVLSHSFMTDVPYLSAMNLALLWYALWAVRRRPVDLCLGGLFTIVAFLMRQIGAVLALVPPAYLLCSRIWGRERRASSWRETVSLCIPFLGIGLSLWWILEVPGLTGTYLGKTGAIRYLFSVSWWLSPYAWWGYLESTVRALVHLGAVLSPLALASLWGRSRRAWVAPSMLVALLVGLFLWHTKELPYPLTYEETLSLEELGAARPLIRGDVSGRQIPGWGRGALLGVSLLSAISLVAALFDGLRRRSRWSANPGAVLVLNGALQFLVIHALWLYYDRYYLTLVPGCIALLMWRMHHARAGSAVAIMGVLASGVLSVSGTIDNFRFSRAVSEARSWVLDQGVPPWQIDAGYVLNGWWLYAHPENLPPGARPESDVPFVSNSTELPYTIANSPLPSYTVVRDVRWRSLWAASDTVYVLRKERLTPSITATASPTPAGSDTTTVAWTTGDGSIGRVYVSKDGGPERLIDRGAEGTHELPSIDPGAMYDVRLYSALEPKQRLSSVTVAPGRAPESR